MLKFNLLLFSCCFGSCMAQKCDWPNDPYEPVASVADFPADPVKIVGWLGFDPFQPDSKAFGVMDVHSLRRHAWNVFAGMTAPSKVSWPNQEQKLARWETWYEVDSEVFNCAATRELFSPLFQSPDLIVMGAHGHKGLKDLIFGTTISAVRHNLKVPLLVVRR